MTTITEYYEQLRAAVRKSPDRSGLSPSISIVTPTWNTRPAWFVDAAVSMLSQTDPHWEWCVVDDASLDTEFHQLFPLLEGLPNVRIVKLTQPHGISEATNVGLQHASGKWVGFLDHDDILTHDAIAEMTAALSNGYDAVYSDLDKLDPLGFTKDPFFKPDWSPEFFRGVMYVGHLLCVRRDVALEIGGFQKEFDGIQDFEFMLRFSEKASRIGHVSKILYHWRESPGSIAADGKAKQNIEKLQCKAVQEQLDRLGLKATAERGAYPHRVSIRRQPAPHKAKVTIVIPTKDAPEHLKTCLHSLFEKSTYRNLEVVCMDNGTTDPDALQTMRSYPVTRICWPGRFNFSAVNNLAVKRTQSDYLVFLNNDVEIATPDWLENMLYYAEQPDVGAVGALLLYPGNKIQHAGVVLGCRGTADHVSRHAAHNCDGYAGSISCAREVSAVTGACLMVKRSTFERAGGFNEHFFTVYQDVDLCLKIAALGLRNIYTPRAVLIHHESVSRGGYYDLVDRNLLLDFWEPAIQRGDPYFNKHFDIQTLDYRLAAHC